MTRNYQLVYIMTCKMWELKGYWRIQKLSSKNRTHVDEISLVYKFFVTREKQNRHFHKSHINNFISKINFYLSL